MGYYMSSRMCVHTEQQLCGHMPLNYMEYGCMAVQLDNLDLQMHLQVYHAGTLLIFAGTSIDT